MAATQTVLIEFQADFSAVEDAVSILEKTGKVDAGLAATFRKTNQEISKQGQAFKTTATTSGTSAQSFTKLNQLMQQFPKSGLNRFLLQVGNELASAGVSADLFFKKAKEGNDLVLPKFDSLKLQLAAVKKKMEEAAKVSGVLSKEYLALKEQAGSLSNAIRDISSDISNAGSDTRGIDNVVGSISALAGGFSAVQGAAALFGSESEDLQKALLRVNAAMALSTGLQQIYNATTKTGSLTRLADTAATGLQIAAQTIYTAVTGRATAATLAFKVALAATGIGLVVIAVLALSQAFKKSNKDLEDATYLIESQNRALESLNTLLQQTLATELARAGAAGKAESDLVRIRGRSLQAQRQNIVSNNRDLVTLRDSLDRTSEAYGRLNFQIDENNKSLKDVDTQIIVESFNLQKALAAEQKQRNDEAAAKARENADKALQQARERRALEFEDFKAGIELKLLAVAKGSDAELQLQKKLLNAKLLIDLEAEKLSINQRKLLIQTYFKDVEDLNKASALKNSDAIKKSAEAGLQDQKSRLDAELENLNFNEDEKSAIKIETLQVVAALEIAAAEGNAAKIKAINAKLNADITLLKIEAIKKSSDYEIALTSAQGGGARRALEATANNEKLKQDVRINALKQLAAIENAAIDKQIAANRKSIAIKGADEKALNLEYFQLLDQKAAKYEEVEKKITGITKSEAEKRKAKDIEIINTTLAAFQEVGSILGEFQQNSDQRRQNEIDNKKREVADLLEAGAITEKEAVKRNKRIDAEERAAKIKSARQQKVLAIFNATVTGAQAIVQAVASAPFPANIPIIALTSALVGAQIAAIASRPLPKFATGKKGTYSGLAEVGEAGAELIHRSDGRMEVAAQRQIVYLGSRDKVFTAGETKNILPKVNKEVMANKPAKDFDYNKMAAAFKGSQVSNNTSINIDKEFISESVANGLMKVKYFDRYYSSK